MPNEDRIEAFRFQCEAIAAELPGGQFKDASGYHLRGVFRCCPTTDAGETDAAEPDAGETDVGETDAGTHGAGDIAGRIGPDLHFTIRGVEPSNNVFPQWGHLKDRRHQSDPSMSIGISVLTRPSKAVAREIMRRGVPMWLEYRGLLLERQARFEERTKRLRNLVAEYAEKTGVHFQYDGDIDDPSARVERLKLRMFHSGRTRTDRGTIPKEAAIAMLQVLTGADAPEKDPSGADPSGADAGDRPQ